MVSVQIKTTMVREQIRFTKNTHATTGKCSVSTWSKWRHYCSIDTGMYLLIFISH